MTRATGNIYPNTNGCHLPASNFSLNEPGTSHHLCLTTVCDSPGLIESWSITKNSGNVNHSYISYMIAIREKSLYIFNAKIIPIHPTNYPTNSVQFCVLEIHNRSISDISFRAITPTENKSRHGYQLRSVLTYKSFPVTRNNHKIPNCLPLSAFASSYILCNTKYRETLWTRRAS